MATHRFSLLPGAYAVVRLGPADPLPQWALESQGLHSVTRTPDELSIVCPEPDVPPDARAESGWRVIRLHGPVPFDQVGVLASFASPLARGGISIFALSTFDTDYLLIRQSQLDKSLRALQAAGHIFVS